MGFYFSTGALELGLMSSLLRNIRFCIILGAIAFSIALYFFVMATSGGELVAKLTRYYGLISLGLLYVVLLIGPAVRVFLWIPYKGKLIFARRGLGISVFYFVVLHSSMAFFLELGGFAGLFYLEGRNLLAVSLGFAAEVILALMAATSFDFAIRKLGYSRWKFLHRFVYLAGFLIIVHTLLIGTDFTDLYSHWAQIWLGLLVVILVVEALAWYKYLRLKRMTIFKEKV